MNIWLVNPFDPLPGEGFEERRYATLARLLAYEDFTVVWWSSTFCHRRKSRRDIAAIRSSLPQGISLEFIDTPSYMSNVGFGRIRNHWVYANQFVSKALSFTPSPDIIIASSPPLNSSWAATHIAHKLGAKVIIDVQDLWPEAFQVVFPSNIRGIAKCLLNPFVLWADRVYQNSDALVAVSEDYLRRVLVVQKKQKPCAVIHLGTDLEFFDSTALHGTFFIEKNDGEFWVIYAGSISRNYDLKTLLNAAHMAQKEDLRQIRFFFAGDGEIRSHFQTLSNKLGLNNSHFLGWLRYEDMVQILSCSDVAVNAIKPASNISFPKKVFEYLAAGLPIINSISGGELELLIKKKNIGLQYTAGDKESLFNAIKNLYYDKAKQRIMSANARRLAESVFDRKIEYQKIIELINQVTAG